MSWTDLRSELAEEFASLFVVGHGHGFRIFNAERKKYSAANYQWRRARGICAFCQALAVPGRATCDEHRNRHSAILYAQRVAAKACGRCGRKPDAGKSTCGPCRAKATAATKRARNQKRAELEKRRNPGFCNPFQQMGERTLTVTAQLTERVYPVGGKETGA